MIKILKKLIGLLSMIEDKLLVLVPKEYRKKVKWAINTVITIAGLIIAGIELF